MDALRAKQRRKHTIATNLARQGNNINKKTMSPQPTLPVRAIISIENISPQPILPVRATISIKNQ